MARDVDVRFSLRDRFTRRLKRAGDGVKSFAAGLGRAAKNAALVSAAIATFASVRLFGGALQSAREFEEQLRTVQAVSGATGEAFDALREAAEKAGTTTRFTATEAAQGLEELTRAGQSVSEAVTTLPSVLVQAQASNISLAESAQFVTTALNQFGLAAADSRRVADVLTRGTEVSAQVITQLGRALNQSAPAARALGLEIEPTVALIGKLADEGFRGEKGGTALRNALLQLEDPSSKFRAELRKLDIDSTDFVDVLAQLEQAGDDSSAALRALGLESSSAIRALVESGSEGLREIVAELNDAEGAAARTAQTMDDNLAGATRGLGSAFDALRRGLVEPLLEPLTETIQVLAQRFRDFAGSDAFATLQTRLASLFSRGAEAATRFIQAIDFEALADDIGDFVESAADGLSKFTVALQTSGSTFALVAGSVGAIINALQFAAQKAAEKFALAGASVDEFFAGLAEIAGNEELAARLRSQASDARAFADTMQTAADGSLREFGEALDSISEAFDELLERSPPAKREVAGVGESAEGAAGAVDDLAQSTGDLADRLDELEGEGILLPMVDSLEDAAGGVDNLARKTEQATDRLRDLETAGDTAGDGFDTASQSARDFADTTEQAAEAAADAAGGIGEVIGGVIASYKNLSAGVAKEVDEIVDRVATQGISVAKFFRDLGGELQSLTRRISDQNAVADDLIDQFDSGAASAEDLGASARAAVNSLELLDNARLDKLTTIIQGADQALQRLQDSAQSALERTEQRLLELQGRQDEAQINRLDDEIAALQQQLDEARAARNLEAAEDLEAAIRNLREIRKLTIDRQKQESRAAQEQHEQNLSHIKDQAQAKEQAERRLSNVRRQLRRQETDETVDQAQRAIDEAFGDVVVADSIRRALERDQLRDFQ